MKLTLKKNIPNLYYAVLVSLPVINDIFIHFTNLSIGLSFPIVFVFIIMMLFLGKYKVPIFQLSVMLTILIFFMFSFLKWGINEVLMDYFFSYLYFGVPTLLYYGYEKNNKKIIFILSIIGVIASIFYLSIGFNSFDGSENMRRSNILVPFVLSVLYIFTTYKATSLKNIIFKVILLASFISYLFMLFSWGTRGALLSIIIFCSLLLMINLNRVDKILLFVLIAIVVVFSTLYFREILVMVKNLINFFGISSVSIDKQIYFIDTQNITNNRTAIWTSAIHEISKNFLFGLGISGFENIYGYYAHNLFLQIALEFGILFFVVLIFIILKGLMNILMNNLSRHDSVYLLILFSSSIIVLSFTSVMWYFPIFWMYIFETINTSKIRKQKNEI